MKCLARAAALLFLFSKCAQAGYIEQVITLDGATPGGFVSLVEGGYIVEWHVPNFGDQPLAIDVGGGNIALGDSVFQGALGNPITVRRVDGDAFDLISLEFANFGTSPSGGTFFAPNITVDFVNLQKFVWTSPTFQEFSPSGTAFSGVTAFYINTIGSGADNYLVDNIRVRHQQQEVPEPASLLLLMSALPFAGWYKSLSRRCRFFAG